MQKQNDKENLTEMFLIDGRIQALNKAHGKLNLLEDIQQGAWLKGLTAALDEQAGMVANSTSIALYDGEDVEHVAIIINNALAIGTFEWLDDIKVGDQVRLVVSAVSDQTLFIHAILRESDQLLWMPYSVEKTKSAWISHGIKLICAMTTIALLIIGSYYLFTNDPFPGWRDFIELAASALLVTMLSVFMGIQGVLSLGQQAENIYCALHIPKFKKFTLKYFSMMDMPFEKNTNYSKKGSIFKFDEALKHHKRKHKLSD